MGVCRDMEKATASHIQDLLNEELTLNVDTEFFYINRFELYIPVLQ